MNNFKYKDIESISLRLASPEDILSWSFGEVTKPETINYKSQKPERDGLFCEKIFGPVKDYECACGKYKKIKNKGVICDRCGVEITESNVRRERFGHIKLETPITHLWMLKTAPGKISAVLNVKTKELEEIIYFVSYIVLETGTTKELRLHEVLNQKQSREIFANVLRELLVTNKFASTKVADECKAYLEILEDPTLYFNFEEVAEFISENTGARFGIGSEAIHELLSKVNLKKEANKIYKDIAKQEGDYQKLVKRLEIIEAFLNSENKPEWMVLTVLPVLPPDLRPIIQLDGGRFTTSDINDIYRRIIIRNDRLKKLRQMGAPAIIVNNEKRMLQEAIDALIDNTRKHKPFLGKDKRPLKSLTDSLKGKQGRFRQNLLGKRVDYSARSVIVVGPELKMYQCGLPRDIALTLFKPFIVSELLSRGLVNNVKIAEKTIQRKTDVVWELLEEVIKTRPVLLNRAPTLHRLGIQAFEPKLVKGKAIHLHPLSTPAFNADFDGDQMAVHLPLSEEAIAESRHLLMGSKNILGLKDGKSIVTPTQDMVLGIYYLTKENAFDKNNLRFFSKSEDVIQALENKLVNIGDVICLSVRRIHEKGFNDDQLKGYIVTTVGKVIFNNVFPETYPWLNNEKSLNVNNNPLIDDVFVFADKTHSTKTCHYIANEKDLAKFIEARKTPKPFTKKILSLAISHLHTFFKKNTAKTLDGIKDLGFKYSTQSSVTISMFDLEFSEKGKKDEILDYKKTVLSESDEKVKKLLNLWRKGLLTKSEYHRHVVNEWSSAKDKVQKYLEKFFQTDKVKNNPIFMMMDSGARGNISNFTQLAGMRGLMNNPKGEIIELPIKSSFREGLSVAEYFISTHGARKGMADTALKTADSGYLTRRLVDVAQDVIISEEDCGTREGFLVKDIVDTKQNSIIVPLFDRIVGRYSLYTINNKQGNPIVNANELITEAMAHEIVESGISQVEIRSVLRCNSKHGICQKCYGVHLANGEPVNIGEAVGTIAAQSIGEPGTQLTMRTFHTGGVFGASDITQGFPRIKELFDVTKPKGKVSLISEVNGTVKEIKDHEDGFYTITVAYKHLDDSGENVEAERKYRTTYGASLRVKEKEPVKIGQKLTDGSINLRELLEVADSAEVEKYIIKEVQRVYRIQGIEIADKYIEIIVRQMLNRMVVLNAGETSLTPGSKLTRQELKDINLDAFIKGKTPAYAIPILLGIKKAPLETNSFLSAASFQDTTRVLALAAVKHKTDTLNGLKENVIIGSLIPSGTSLLSSEEIIALGEKAKSEQY